MFYKLLGMIVWNGAKLIVRTKLGFTSVPKPVLAGGVLAIALGALGVAIKARTES